MIKQADIFYNAGKIWHLNASPSDLHSTCYNQITSDGKCEMRGAIWRLPPDKTNYGSDDSSSSFPSLELITDLDLRCQGIQKHIVGTSIW